MYLQVNAYITGIAYDYEFDHNYHNMHNPYTTDKSVTDLLQICYVCCISVTELSQINRVFTDLLYICHYTVDNYKLHFVQIYYRACT